MIRFSLTTCWMFLVLNLWAQEIPLGTWRTHTSYRETTLVTETANRIYAAANGGLYYIDLQDNSINRLTTSDGFQGGQITALESDPLSGLLLVGYASGNVDIYDGEEVTLADLTTDSQIIGSKSINHILIQNNFAFISTDYGILKFDLIRQETRETYREIGGDAEEIAVYQTAIFQDSLFAATQEGIIAGSLSDESNLADYAMWKRFEDELPGVPAKNIVRAGDRLYSAFDGTGIYMYATSWQETGLAAALTYRSLGNSEDQLLVVTQDQALLYDNNLVQTGSAVSTEISDAYDAVYTADGKWWVADGSNGLVSDIEGTFHDYTPSGPSSSSIFKMKYVDKAVWGLSGGYNQFVDPLNRSDGFYRFQNGQWTNSSEIAGIPEFRDMTDIVRMPLSGDIYISSAGYGLLRMKGDEYEVIDENTPGSPLINTGSPSHRVTITAVTESENGIWMINYGATPSLHYYDSEGLWQSYSPTNNLAKYGLGLVQAGDLLWIRIDPAKGGGLVVYNPDTNESRYLGTTADEGSLASDDVQCMALDKDGLLWIGTDKGISVINNPFRMTGAINAAEPVFDGRPLLVDETITDIQIDGGNRKWIGTENGVWLFDEGANKLLRHFTRENGPLPSDDIVSISIYGETGEVFFGTDQGIVSYRADATEGGKTYSNVKIFPNPVSKNFTGTVGITGLASDASVKITDVSGRLIYQTQAQGGTASWDLGSNSASGLQSGMYMVFSGSEDGKETYVGKFAIIR